MLEKLSAALPQPVRFAVVGVLNTILDIGVFTLLVSLGAVPAPAANVVSYSCGLLNSFALNRLWTFSGAHGRSTWRQFERFLAVNLLALGLSTLTVWLLAAPLGVLPAKLAAVLATYLFGFITNKRLVFSCA